MTSPFALDGRTAIVTGGNQGFGKAFAFALAEAGARVAIVGRSAERNMLSPPRPRRQDTSS